MITILGSEGYINQIDRLRSAFSELGLLSGLRDAEWIYCNDPSAYDSALLEKQKRGDVKLIFNVLDYPPHLMNSKVYDLGRYTYFDHPFRRDFNVENLTDKLRRADVITVICAEVKRQVREYSNLDAKVIYNPIKPVDWKNVRGSIPFPKFLFVGRANDPNKRFWIASGVVKRLAEERQLAVVGTENPGFGIYLGQLTDEGLNYCMNLAKFLFLPSAFKSVGLPALEAVVAKCIPVVCDDDPCTAEFFPGLGLPPDPAVIAKHLSSDNWLNKASQFVEENSELFKKRFSASQIAKNILSLCR